MLFAFAVEDDVAWENNAAERGLRPLVVNRKVSYGSRSLEGAQRLAAMHSIARTVRLRNESFFAFRQWVTGSRRHARNVTSYQIRKERRAPANRVDPRVKRAA